MDMTFTWGTELTINAEPSKRPEHEQQQFYTLGPIFKPSSLVCFLSFCIFPPSFSLRRAPSYSTSHRKFFRPSPMTSLVPRLFDATCVRVVLVCVYVRGHLVLELPSGHHVWLIPCICYIHTYICIKYFFFWSTINNTENTLEHIFQYKLLWPDISCWFPLECIIISLGKKKNKLLIIIDEKLSPNTRKQTNK